MRRRLLVARGGWRTLPALAALVLLLTSVTVALGAPGGNNGTVKIHDGASDSEPIVKNEPRVCTFHLHFFFADPAQSGAWKIETWAPGDKGDVVLEGTYDTTADGEDRQPATGVYTLPDGHYRLSWQGRNTQNVKHKTFWVECAAPTTSPSPSPTVTASPEPTGSEEPTSSGSSPSGEVLPATGKPSGIELPETDTLSVNQESPGLALVLLVLSALTAATVLVTQRAIWRRR